MRASTNARMVVTVIVLWAGVFALAADALGTTWIVESDGTGHAPTITAAIENAALGDTVNVGCGTYFEAGIDMKDGVVLTSRSGTPDCVTIDGQGLDSVLRFRGVNAAARVLGITITGGNSAFGGGVDCASASYPTFEDCVITGNRAGEGGGVFSTHAAPTFRRCRIDGNVATRWGGGISCYDNSIPTLEHCTIVGNAAGELGGGVWTYFFASPPMFHCVVAGNTAGDAGGGMFLFESISLVENCTIAANESHRGGGLALESSKPTIRNTILRDNCAAGGRELAFFGSVATADFSCCNVDTSSGWRDGTGSVTVRGGLQAEDPRFCAPMMCGSGALGTGSEYALQDTSPCLADNNACGVQIGALGAGCDGSTPAPPVAARRGEASIRCWPNPFVKETGIVYSIPRSTEVDLRIFDAAGRLIRALENGAAQEAGPHLVSWDGRDVKGRLVAAGVYFARLKAGPWKVVQRIVRIR